MGFLDKAKDLLGKHEEKVEGAIDKVAEVVDEKTGGKHTDQIEKGVDAAKDFIDGDGENVTVDGDGENVTVGDEEGGTPPAAPAVP